VKLFRASLRVFVLLVVLGIAAGVYVAYAPYGDTAAHPFNQDRNAVWLEHRWLERAHPEAEMAELFADRQQALFAQPLDKPARGRHRTHGVRTGWTDADLEQIESAANQIESPESGRWARDDLCSSSLRARQAISWTAISRGPICAS